MPSTTYDKGSIIARVRDAHKKIIKDRVRFTLVNQRVRSFNRQFPVTFLGREVRIKGDIPAGPVGLYQVFITPERYRDKSIFLMVLTNKPAIIDEVFFVDPGKVKPDFPSHAALQRERVWKKLLQVLTNSNYPAAKYNSLEDLPKAGMFNLFAKMEATSLPDGSTIFDHVLSLSNPRPARFYANVDAKLLQLVTDDRVGFHAVPGALHNFPPGWERIENLGSFKTLDMAGNLQLTFATNARGEFLVDADLDDHQGIEHAFDVLKHRVTGKDTHPYDIHQILAFFQGIEPGYLLA